VHGIEEIRFYEEAQGGVEEGAEGFGSQAQEIEFSVGGGGRS